MLPRDPQSFWSPLAGILLVGCALIAGSCKGIAEGTDRPDTEFGRDTSGCETRVEYCTCYCAVRCGETCVERRCYDPCPSDGPNGRNGRDGGFPEERLPDGDSGVARPDADVRPGPDAVSDVEPRDVSDSTLQSDAEADTSDTGRSSDGSRDSTSNDTSPLDADD